MICPRCQTPLAPLRLTCQACQHLVYLAKLRALNHNSGNDLVTLPQRDFTLGREEKNDWVLNVAGVSRRHLRVHFAEGVYWAEDCGSKNGVFINGSRVHKTILCDQDCVQIGAARFYFFLTENTAGSFASREEVAAGAVSQKTRSSNPAAACAENDHAKWQEWVRQHLLQGALRLAHAQEARKLQQLLAQAAACFAPASAREPGGQEREEIFGQALVKEKTGAGKFAAPAKYDLAYCSRPSGAVGGDYVEVIALHEAEALIVIGDVAGKGAAAAQMRDRLQACLRLHVLYESRLENLAQALNQIVCALGPAATFTTLFLGLLQGPRGVLRYVNAGHNPGVMIYPPTATPRYELLRGSGAALGVLERNVLAEKEIVIPAGATLIFYTDGVTEAVGADSRQYGLTRLIECATTGIFSSKNLSAQNLLQLLQEDLPYAAAHAVGISRPQDDQSILVIVARGG